MKFRPVITTAVALVALSCVLAQVGHIEKPCRSGGAPWDPGVPPRAPSGLAATPVSANRINLSWTDNAFSEFSERVLRCTGVGCSQFAPIAVIAADSTSYSDTGLIGSTSYSYLVQAVNQQGTSAPSNVVSATTFVQPLPNMMQADQGLTCTNANLACDVVPNATAYRFYLDGFPTCNAAGSGSLVPSCGIQLMTVPGHSYQVTAKAVVSGVDTAVGTPLTLTPNCAAPAHGGIGSKSMFVLLVNWPDYLQEPKTRAETDTLVFTNANAWIQTASFGSLSIHGSTVGYLTMDQSRSNYCLQDVGGGLWSVCGNAWQPLHDQAVAAYGDLSSYWHEEYFWAGVGTRREGNIERSWHNVFTDGGFTVNAVAHSIGHAAGGMLHTGTWKGSSSSPDVGSDLYNPNTGGFFASRFGGHDPLGDNDPTASMPEEYAAFHKEIAGWIPPAEAVTATIGTATYHVGAVNAAFSSGNPREVRVPLGIKDWFYSLDYVPGYGVRVFVHVGQGVFSVWSDADLYGVNHNAPITTLDPLEDPYRGITVTMSAMDSQKATLSITSVFSP